MFQEGSEPQPTNVGRPGTSSLKPIAPVDPVFNLNYLSNLIRKPSTRNPIRSVLPPLILSIPVNPTLIHPVQVDPIPVPQIRIKVAADGEEIDLEKELFGKGKKKSNKAKKNESIQPFKLMYLK